MVKMGFEAVNSHCCSVCVNTRCRNALEMAQVGPKMVKNW